MDSNPMTDAKAKQRPELRWLIEECEAALRDAKEPIVGSEDGRLPGGFAVPLDRAIEAIDSTIGRAAGRIHITPGTDPVLVQDVAYMNPQNVLSRILSCFDCKTVPTRCMACERDVATLRSALARPSDRNVTFRCNGCGEYLAAPSYAREHQRPDKRDPSLVDVCGQLVPWPPMPPDEVIRRGAEALERIVRDWRTYPYSDRTMDDPRFVQDLAAVRAAMYPEPS